MNTTSNTSPHRTIGSTSRTARRVICTGVLAVALSSGVTSAARADSTPTASGAAATTIVIVASDDDAADAAGRAKVVKVKMKIDIVVRPTGG